MGVGNLIARTQGEERVPHEILNFDLVGYDVVPIEKTVPKLDEHDQPVVYPPTGEPVRETRHWELRDDVPAERMIRLFALVQKQARETGPKLATLEDAEQLVAEMDRTDEVMTNVCLSIFRHTYPTTSEAQLRAWFTTTERQAIVSRFFFPRGSESSPAPPSTPSTPSPMTMTTEEAETRTAEEPMGESSSLPVASMPGQVQPTPAAPQPAAHYQPTHRSLKHKRRR